MYINRLYLKIFVFYLPQHTVLYFKNALNLCCSFPACILAPTKVLTSLLTASVMIGRGWLLRACTMLGFIGTIVDAYCRGCHPGTRGYCRSSAGVCYPYHVGTKCYHGTWKCSKCIRGSCKHY